MILRSLRIWDSNLYSNKPPEYRCEVEFRSTHGDVKLNLPQETAQRVLEVCAELVAQAGRETAQALTAEVIQAAGQPAIDSDPSTSQQGESL